MEVYLRVIIIIRVWLDIFFDFLTLTSNISGALWDNNQYSTSFESPHCGWDGSNRPGHSSNFTWHQILLKSTHDTPYRDQWLVYSVRVFVS